MKQLLRAYYKMDACWSLPLWIPAFAGVTKGAGMTFKTEFLFVIF